MEIRWGKHRASALDPVANQDGTPDITFTGRPLGDLMTEIVENHAREGGFENLKGKGQPLQLDGDLPENYYLTKVLKNANVLPSWLELQHEIRDAIRAFVCDMANTSADDLNHREALINEKIYRYNRECPHPSLQKPVFRQSLAERQLTFWE